MQFNEKRIFLKNKKTKNKIKYAQKKENEKEKRKKLFFFIIILICFILFIVIIKKLFNNFYNNNKSEKSIGTKKVEASSYKNKPKIVAITYGNIFFKRQLELNKKSALEVGQVDEHHSYGPKNIDKEFWNKNHEILSKPRGNGYWLWKPYIINKTMVEKLNYGDYLIYTDAAMIFMNSSRLLINFLKENNASMWFNRLTLKEKKYSKRDAFIIMGVDNPVFSETNQYMAGIQIYRKSDYTMKFIQEWLTYCQDKRIITNEKNTLGQPNYPGFVENRHDQTALSLLIKKYGEANAGSPNLTLEELKQRKSVIMPNILCMYRRRAFSDYENLKEKCQPIIEHQNHIFS